MLQAVPTASLDEPASLFRWRRGPSQSCGLLGSGSAPPCFHMLPKALVCSSSLCDLFQTVETPKSHRFGCFSGSCPTHQLGCKEMGCQQVVVQSAGQAKPVKPFTAVKWLKLIFNRLLQLEPLPRQRQLSDSRQCSGIRCGRENTR